MPNVRLGAVICLSLVYALASAQGLGALRHEIDQATMRGQMKQALDAHQSELGETLYDRACQAVGDDDQGAEQATVTPAQRAEVVDVIRAAEALTAPSPQTQDPKATAETALRRAGFKDPGRTTTKNWAARGMDKVWDSIRKWLDGLDDKHYQGPRASTPFLGFLTPVIWFVLGAAVLGFLAWALVTFAGMKARKAKHAGGLMDDDEPERTADEWLTKADELERQGEFRLAVRCLYVATLIRLDEGNVARFRRWETNWEHLQRIESSQRKPAGYSIRPATEKFDVVWYGHQVDGKADLDLFRNWYREAMHAMGRRV